MQIIPKPDSDKRTETDQCRPRPPLQGARPSSEAEYQAIMDTIEGPPMPTPYWCHNGQFISLPDIQAFKLHNPPESEVWYVVCQMKGPTVYVRIGDGFDRNRIFDRLIVVFTEWKEWEMS